MKKAYALGSIHMGLTQVWHRAERTRPQTADTLCGRTVFVSVFTAAETFREAIEPDPTARLCDKCAELEVSP